MNGAKEYTVWMFPSEILWKSLQIIFFFLFLFNLLIREEEPISVSTALQALRTHCIFSHFASLGPAWADCDKMFAKCKLSVLRSRLRRALVNYPDAACWRLAVTVLDGYRMELWHQWLQGPFKSVQAVISRSCFHICLLTFFGCT